VRGRRWHPGGEARRHVPLRGAEAVIDKELTASLLARQLHADALLLTDVDAVQDDYGTPQARAIHMAAIGQLAEAQALLSAAPERSSSHERLPRGTFIVHASDPPSPGGQAPRPPG
jgi:hypothetical protein